MAKAIPATELKNAVKALNVVLKKNKETPIKIVGTKKEDVVEAFTNTILDFIDKNKAKELPKAAVDVYNNYIVPDDDGGEDTPVDDSTKKEDKDQKQKSGTRDKQGSGSKPNTAGTRTRRSSGSKPNTANKPKNDPKAKTGIGGGSKSKQGKKTDSSGGKSVVEWTADLFLGDGMDNAKDITKKLEPKFPGRNIGSTVSSALGVLRHAVKYIEIK